MLFSSFPDDIPVLCPFSQALLAFSHLFSNNINFIDLLSIILPVTNQNKVLMLFGQDIIFIHFKPFNLEVPQLVYCKLRSFAWLYEMIY